MKITELSLVFLKHIPEKLENGILYISEEFEICIHLCACGCGEKTPLPFNRKKAKGQNWKLVHKDGKVSLTPSIGNFSGQNPYHAHYYITNNIIVWC